VWGGGRGLAGGVGSVSLVLVACVCGAAWRLFGPNGVHIGKENDGVRGTMARIPATSGYFALPLTAVYSIYVTSNPNGATGNYSLNLSTAPLASISGKVTSPDGLGLRNAGGTITDQGGISRRVTTSSFGVFQFDNVAVGEAYFIGVASKRYRFETRSVQVDGNLANVDFVGLQ